MSRRLVTALAAALVAGGGLLAAAALPAHAAGKINDDPESRRLATECLLKVAEKLPKISGLKIISESMEQHGDLFEGSYFVTAVHRQVFYDYQCLAESITVTDLKGKSSTAKRVEKVWLNVRIP